MYACSYSQLFECWALWLYLDLGYGLSNQAIHSVTLEMLISCWLHCLWWCYTNGPLWCMYSKNSKMLSAVWSSGKKKQLRGRTTSIPNPERKCTVKLMVRVGYRFNLINSDSFRLPVSIPMWLNNGIKHLSCLFLANHLLELNTTKKKKNQQATSKLDSLRAVCAQNRAAWFWINWMVLFFLNGSCGSLMILKKKILDN